MMPATTISTRSEARSEPSEAAQVEIDSRALAPLVAVLVRLLAEQQRPTEPTD